MGKFTIFDFLRVRRDAEVVGSLSVTGGLTAGSLACAGVAKTVKGSIKYDASGIATKASVGITLPKGAIVTRAAAVVTTAFNAGTTNVLTIGYSSDTDALMASGDITEDATGANIKERMDAALSANSVVYAQYTQTGTAATAGAADIYITYIEQI